MSRVSYCMDLKIYIPLIRPIITESRMNVHYILNVAMSVVLVYYMCTYLKYNDYILMKIKFYTVLIQDSNYIYIVRYLCVYVTKH